MKYPLKINSNFLFIHGRDLDSQNSLKVPSTGIFCFAYRFTDVSDELWTRRITAFKNNNSTAVSKLSKLIGLKSTLLKPHVHGECACIGVISHHKRNLTSNDPVFILGQEVAKNLSIDWTPNLICKTPHKSLHSGRLNLSQRDSIISGCYTINRSLEKDIETIVIVDDICTTGASYKDCIRAIKDENPSLKRCICISAGKAEKQEYHQSHGIRLDNNHLPEEYNELWGNL